MGGLKLQRMGVIMEPEQGNPIVNIKGVKQYLKLDLSDQEQELFKYSANTLKNIIKTIEL